MKPTTAYLFLQFTAALLILLFVYTATSKLLDIVAFQNTIAQFPLLQRHPLIIAWVIPISELIIAGWLFFPATRIFGFYTSLGLLLLFTEYIAYALLTEQDLPCSCGGVISKMSWTQHLLFNLFFAGLALAGIIVHRKHKLLISRSSRIPVAK